MAKIIEISENLPDNIKKLLENINDYVSFEEGEDVGEDYSPEIVQNQLIVRIDPRIETVLRDLACIGDSRVIPPLLSMLHFYPDNPKRRWIYWPRFTGHDYKFMDDFSSPLWQIMGNKVGNTIESIIQGAEISSEELARMCPDLVKYGFIDK